MLIQRSDDDKSWLLQSCTVPAIQEDSQQSRKIPNNCLQEYPILRTLYKSNHHVFSTWHPHINAHVNREITHNNDMAALHAKLRDIDTQMVSLNQQQVQAQ